MHRRKFIRTAGLSLASVLIYDSLVSRIHQERGQPINDPDEVTAIVNGVLVKLSDKGNHLWTYQDIIVELKINWNSVAVEIQAPKVNLISVSLHWKIPDRISSYVLNDHWERTYGDVSWHKPNGSELLPWYFMEYDGLNTNGFGVKTGSNTFCFWQLGGTTLSLTLDTLSGGCGVQLGDRTLKAAEIVTIKSDAGESPFETTRRFTTIMCDKARMPRQPVYRINDWYFSYGNTSEKLIIEHTEMMAPMAEGLENRPFSVIDAGWFKGPPSAPNDCCWGDDMKTHDEKFGDMHELTEKIRKIGMRPGLWTRPLCGSHKDPASFMLPCIKGREENKPVLDPTIPENLERIQNYFKLYNQWSYELVKIDFTTFDVFGKWGFEMLRDCCMTQAQWNMHDTSKTNAEIILNLYKTIREAAGDIYLLGCNTFSHLSAGIFELNRIGDDTSGNEWERTRNMGVNTLAFRGLHQGTFYAADSDCVGLTLKVPWGKNKQWMELVAKSGTPLFISAQPEATGTLQKEVIKQCFKLASQNIPVGEPLDWMESAFPQKWKLNEKVETFDWN
jgi:alpha-galactosidase